MYCNNQESLLDLENLLIENKNLRLIIAPRHPERAKEIVSICNSNNLKCCLESKQNLNSKNVLIIDSFGILSDYFKISDIIFLGGSLIPAGGHNPIEPAIHKCAILTGSYLFNWQNIFDNMIENKACLKFESFNELTISLKNLIKDNKKIEILKTNAYNFSKREFVNTKYLDKIMKKLININIC